MTRPARVGAGWAAVLAGIALGIAGCGSTTRHADYPVSTLCVAVGLPTSGPDSATGRALLQGLEEQIPPAGIDIDGYSVELCRSPGYRARKAASAPLDGLLNNAFSASADKHTIAYVGALTGAQAADIDTVLGEADIPLVTPSSPLATGSAPTRRSATGQAVAEPDSAFYLLPSENSQADALSAVRLARGCDRVTRKHRLTCTLVTSAPLCSGIATATSAQPARLCVLAGPDLSRYAEPAVAYGYSAGLLLRNTFEELIASGADIASRSAVMRQLRRENLKQTPIGPIHFDAGGGIVADHFTVYTVQDNGRLANPQTFSAH